MTRRWRSPAICRTSSRLPCPSSAAGRISGFSERASATRLVLPPARTRIWTSILLDNSRSIIHGLDAMQHQLELFKKAIADHDEDGIKTLLQLGKTSRQALDRQIGEP